MAGNMNIICLTAVISILPSLINCQTYSIDNQTPEDCKKSASDAVHEYFDISQLKCRPCQQGNGFQTVSADGLKCVCVRGMRLTRDFGGGSIQCDACAANQVTSGDGWNCVACGADTPFDPLTQECKPCTDGIAAERYLNGTWNQVNNVNTQQCTICSNRTSPNLLGNRCERCNQVLSMLPGQGDCDCPTDQQSGGICFRERTDLVAVRQSLYEVKYEDGTTISSSEYFLNNIRSAQGMCNVTYNNLTACQLLGNLCVMLMYTRENDQDIRANPDGCSLYSELANRRNALPGQRPENMPWLYYGGDTADRILTSPQLTTEYTFPNSRLQFRMARYDVDGKFVGMTNLDGGELQLCQAPQETLGATYSFGTEYTRSCKLYAQDLWNNYNTVFHDIFLEFVDAGVNKLYAVPILIDNYKDKDGRFVNRENDQQIWQLVRRFFLIDNTSGKPSGASGSSGTTGRAQVIRYPQSIIVYVNLQTDAAAGRIYPPYIGIKYALLKTEDYNSNKQVDVSFSVQYRMNLDRYNNDMAIAAGVLSAFAVIYAGMLTWGWNKRAGKLAIDFVTLIKFLLYAFGALANVFFVVAYGSALWWLIFYKRQTAVYLFLPGPEQEERFLAYVGVAFGLKALQVLHMIISQVTVDIFFIDWERPRGGVVQASDHKQTSNEASVSIWRTYFVANEWNEIQTVRKINQIFQIFAVIFFLHVVGFENIATRDPFSSFSFTTDQYRPSNSRILRFALGTSVYLLVAIVQWIFYTFIYERFIEDKVRQYVDLCSMSNVSVFILENAQFGYYIHGRSVHGRADTGMREMHENLKREEEDLCGQRGLMPGSEQQTFQMAVPRKLRLQYDRVLMPLTQPQTGAGQNAPLRGDKTGGTSHIDAQTEKSIQAYSVINRFLQAFIDHSLRDLDYIIKDKLLFESVLNVEFQDTSEKGFLYNDGGHSFDAVLFFGNEVTLLLFETLFFGIIDLMAQNFILAAVLTYIVMELLCIMRDSLGRKNLAKKTLVDERFLI